MARLPQPGGDVGNWGQILNEYLSQVHNGDGTLKPNIIQSANLATDAVNNAALANGSVSNTTLAVSGGLDGQVLMKDSSQAGGLSWTSASGGAATTLGGDLSGTAANAQIVAGAVGTAELADGAVSSAKLSSALSTALSNKADASSLSAVATSGSYSDLTNTPSIPAQFAPIAGTNITLSGTYPNITFNASTGTGTTNLGVTASATDVMVTSDTGTDATIATATSTTAGMFSGADKSKLDGIASGSTANQTDAYLLNRANHTGTQAISTVTNLQTSLDAKLDASKVGAASGAASLDASGKVPSGQLPTFDKSLVGLGNVDNTSDTNKPVSSATQTALDLKFDKTNVDTDDTLAANSDTKVASQKAAKTYVDTRLATKVDASAVGAKVLLIDNAASLPAGTPAGVVVVVKV